MITVAIDERITVRGEVEDVFKFVDAMERRGELSMKLILDDEEGGFGVEDILTSEFYVNRAGQILYSTHKSSQEYREDGIYFGFAKKGDGGIISVYEKKSNVRLATAREREFS